MEKQVESWIIIQISQVEKEEEETAFAVVAVVCCRSFVYTFGLVCWVFGCLRHNSTRKTSTDVNAKRMLHTTSGQMFIPSSGDAQNNKPPTVSRSDFDLQKFWIKMEDLLGQLMEEPETLQDECTLMNQPVFNTRLNFGADFVCRCRCLWHEPLAAAASYRALYRICNWTRPRESAFALPLVHL